MTQPRQTFESLVERVAEASLGEHVLAATFLGETPAFALADGRVVLGLAAEDFRTVHDGGTLVAASCPAGLLTGGEDGRIALTTQDGAVSQIGEERGRWIDSVAAGPNNAFGWTVGKTAKARLATGLKELALPSTSRGLAFAPKGTRLAISHIDGASLWFPNTDAAPEKLNWKGPHIDITWSPDGRFVVTSMQDNQLHGWRLSDKGHMRMSGYPGKTRAFSWSSDGNWLATSGAEAAIVWPFAKDGPMGKAPRECGVRPRRVSQVAFHPAALVLAIGYEDGWIILVRLTDAAEILIRKSDAGPVSALAWDGRGKRLLFGTEDGAAGLLELPG